MSPTEPEDTPPKGEAAHEFAYDAFVSYAHADSETVEWLHRRLSRFWVPGRRKRHIYLDQRKMTARSLDDQVEGALRASKYLVVCWSRSARDSDWVSKEIGKFLEFHDDALTKGRILLCRVGGRNDDTPLPDLPQRRPGEAFVPDFRALDTSRRWFQRSPSDEEMCSLLAPIVDYASKDQVLGTRARRRVQLFAGAAALLLVLGAAVIGRAWWASTPSGLFEQTVSTALAPAGDYEWPAHELFTAATSLGRLGREADVEHLSRYATPGGLRELVRATGLASLPEPDCERAEEDLASLDDEWLRTWPRYAFMVGRACDASWIEKAFPPLDSPDAVAAAAEELAAAGLGERAELLLARSDFPPNRRFPVRITLVATSPYHRKPLHGKEVVAWLLSNESPPDAFDIMEQLERIDRLTLWADPVTLVLLQAAQRYVEGQPDEEYANWTWKQRLASYLTAAGQKTEAQRLLDATDPADADDLMRRVAGEAPEGWAWRGLALARLGDESLAAGCLEEAERIALVPVPQSRSWREWWTIARVHAARDDWRRAFLTASQPRDPYAQLGLRLFLIELWADRQTRK